MHKASCPLGLKRTWQLLQSFSTLTCPAIRSPGASTDSMDCACTPKAQPHDRTQASVKHHSRASASIRMDRNHMKDGTQHHDPDKRHMGHMPHRKQALEGLELCRALDRQCITVDLLTHGLV